MALAPGTRLGVYEVTAQIGAGGMGEVYRAHDTKLNRDVALKVLPDSFASDPDRLARFTREAQTLASLNHPNIAHIYGIEESNGVRALVMELVQGEDLSERIARGAIPVDEALPIAKQIAEALEAAHEQGIIHRDLKPANIKVRADGTVKVLDFGLAKAMEPTDATSVSVSQSPTITSPAMMTGVGMILGTAAYMSPEQARGKVVDKRTDIWAFGCVLYEMLTGRRAFIGENVSDTLAFVLTRQPDWNAVPAATPRAIRTLLRRCLEKDRKRRLADSADARLEIDEALTMPEGDSATESRAPSLSGLPRSVLAGAGGFLLGSLLVAFAMWDLRPSASSEAITRFPLPLAEGQRFGESGSRVLAISRDGARIVFAAGSRLYLRSMSELEARPISGTEIAVGQVRAPVFSPDGQSIAFVTSAPAHIKRVAVTGGAAVTICEGCGPLGAISWDSQGIVFAQGGQGLPPGFAGERARQGTSRIMRVAPDGGEPQLLFDVADGTPWDVQLLPDGETVLFGLVSDLLDRVGSVASDEGKIVVQSLKSGRPKTIVANGSAPRYLATGHIVYVREGVLFAKHFDLGRLEAIGDEVPVVEGVRRAGFLGGSTTAAYFDVSDTGSLMYIPGPAATAVRYDLALLDPQSGVQPLKLTPNAYEFPRVSPDGRWIAVGTNDGKVANIWVYERSRASAIRQLTFIGKNRYPIWSAAGRFVTFQSDREGDLGLFQQRADGSGTAERLTKSDPGTAHVPNSWSPDGNTLLFEVIKDSGRTLWVFSTGDRKIAQVGDIQMETGGATIDATFSPNGRWLAYRSAADNGAPAVSVEPFPVTGSKFLIDNGLNPVWSRDGKTLFFRRLTTGDFVATRVTTESAFSFSTPQQLPMTFPGRQSISSARNHDITPDGKFIGVVPAGQGQADTRPQINVVLNWTEELKRLVPTD
jgi:serine/threonine-protein kinase